MTTRNLSPQAMFIAMAREHRPQFQFEPGTDFAAWKARALPAVLATLGDFPAPVPPNPELLAAWDEGSLRKERWIVDVGPHISATLLVNRPANATGRLPALLCCHGHGPLGKGPVMGQGAGPEFEAQTAQFNYGYGQTMAERGYLTYAIDWIGFGERNDTNKPNHWNQNYGRDWCNLYYLHATMLGMTSLSINVAHGRAATDVVAARDDVDAGRLGVMGLSGGGTMALWMSLCDERFKATEIIGYSDLWAAFGLRDVNYCGMQVAPGLFKRVDLPELQGLLAPRPLLVDIGVYDTCFVVDTAMACHRRVRAIYEAAGAADRLELDLFPGEHAWGDHRSEPFFRKHLAPAPA